MGLNVKVEIRPSLPCTRSKLGNTGANAFRQWKPDMDVPPDEIEALLQWGHRLSAMETTDVFEMFEADLVGQALLYYEPLSGWCPFRSPNREVRLVLGGQWGHMMLPPETNSFLQIGA